MLEQIKKYPKPLQLSIYEGMAASLMLGGGAIFLIPFAVYLGANSLQVGLLSAIPALLGAWSQLGAIRLLELYKKRRTAIIATVFMQAISWLLIAAIPFIFPQNQINWLIIIATLGTLAGSIGGPLWQSWMRSLTPQEILGEYFGVRNSITGAVVFFTMLLSGILLQIVEPSLTLYAFSAIFLVSFIGRMLSSLIFIKIEDPEIVLDGTEKTRLTTFLKQLRKDNFGYFITFGALMTLSIAMVTPFFALYLLNNLGLSSNYFLYTIIICASAATSLLSMPYWGKIIDAYGTIRALKASGLLIAIYPLALIFVRDPLGLIAFESLHGIILSGFNLCLANFIYASFKPEKIIKYAGYQNMLFGTATFIGVLISGYLLTFNFSFDILTNTFYVICLIAVISRLLIFTTLVNKIKEVRETKPINDDTLVMNVLTFEPVRETIIGGFVPIIVTTQLNIKDVTARTIYTVEKIGKSGEERVIGTINKVGTVTKNELNKVKDLMKRKTKGFI